MTQRILSTLCLWAIVFATVWFGGVPGAVVMLTLMAVLTMRECQQLLARIGGTVVFARGSLAVGALMMLAPYLIEPHVPALRAEMILALSLALFSVRILGERSPESRAESLAWTLVGTLLIPFTLHYLVRILMIQGPSQGTGLALALWLVAVSKFCDTGALLTGLAIGRHKMAPTISPKKTWEGAVGGPLVSMGVGAFIAWAWARHFPLSFTPLLAALVALPIAVLAIVSDLLESAIKRRADIKDTGSAIPGIGGLFDLTDSFMLTAPMGYLIFTLL